MNVLFDMETNDPDDMMTLCWLASHPKVKLRAVTVMPGTPDQLGLIKKVLEMTENTDIILGSWKYAHEKSCVNPFHFDWLGRGYAADAVPEGWEIIQESIKAYPDLVIVTGAPLKNFARIRDTIELEHWVAQGGFAGDSIVPVEYRLEKFVGRETCPTFNFNGDWKTAMAMLENPRIKKRHLVSKNVCHGVVYNQDWHDRLKADRYKTAGLDLIYKGMDLYLKKRPEGKKFHDPLAAAVAVDPSICEFREVKLYRQKGDWGSYLSEDSNTFISINMNLERFWEVFVMN